MKRIRLGLIGDFDENVIAHGAISKAVALGEVAAGCQSELKWLPTNQILKNDPGGLADFQGFWCVPGSPYADMDGALAAIQYARERNIPFLGTCGGFQHAVIEYARNVLGISDADHQESNSQASKPIISKLSCSLVNKSEMLVFAKDSRLARIYGATEAKEGYQCNYGLNPEFERLLGTGPLRLTAFGADKSAHALELSGHPFFIATLFQPERSALRGTPHPLVIEYLKAACGSRSGAQPG